MLFVIGMLVKSREGDVHIVLGLQLLVLSASIELLNVLLGEGLHVPVLNEGMLPNQILSRITLFLQFKVAEVKSDDSCKD
jgi:hypothetical protein